MTEAYDDRFIRFSHATESVLKAITRYKNDCLARYGLRGMHLMTMVCLSRSGADGLTPGELARLCGVDKAFLLREWHKAQKGELTHDCRKGCVGCGMKRYEGACV